MEYDVVAWAKADVVEGALPGKLSAPVHIAYYLHPESLKPWWHRLRESELGVLQIASSGTTIHDAARAAGVPPAGLRTQFEKCLKSGLLTGI